MEMPTKTGAAGDRAEDYSAIQGGKTRVSPVMPRTHARPPAAAASREQRRADLGRVATRLPERAEAGASQLSGPGHAGTRRAGCAPAIGFPYARWMGDLRANLCVPRRLNATGVSI
jgi:hypothetical protein